MTESPLRNQPVRDLGEVAVYLPRLTGAISDRLIAMRLDRDRRSDRAIVAATAIALDYTSAVIGGRGCVESLGALEQSAARWARQGVELSTITPCLHRGMRMVIDELSAAFDAQTNARVLFVLFSALKTLSVTVSSAYMGELTRGPHNPEGAEYSIASAVLAGRDMRAAARDAGIALANNYWVFAIAFGEPLGSRARIRTWWRSTRHELVRQRRLRGGGDPLAVVGRDLATVLVPTSQLAEPDTRGVAELISQTLGRPIHAVVEDADRRALRGTANTGHELVRLARRNGYPGGLYRFGDLAVERLLARPGIERDRLIAVIAPLVESSYLLDTLRAHLATGLSRPRTIELLHIHLNTLDYRLRRIERLTGLDARDPAQQFRLRAALIAYDSARPDQLE
ncbi:PucR family transcriptional regulator [Nocardia kruczakiae]|uniref:PucR family transcriptional regulator n=1 Tax=Nocardia kruczakiae TaxID=261477 RepID=UPI000A7DB4A1|nr:helix-turn-helix domain-containing protein [Nocardia kruczakiae]